MQRAYVITSPNQVHQNRFVADDARHAAKLWLSWCRKDMHVPTNCPIGTIEVERTGEHVDRELWQFRGYPW